MAPDTISVRGRAVRGLSYSGRGIIIIYLGIDSLILPLFRPTSRWLAGRALVHAAQRRVASLPPYVILCVLALPFAIAEPAKILALYLMATGHVKIGLMVLAGAYFVSLVIVERLFRGGRTKLLTIPWFKTTWQWLMAQRRRLLKWARSTRIWASFVKSKGRIRAQFVYLTRFKNRFSAPAGFSEVNAAVSHTLPSSVAGDADCVALDHSKRRSFS